MSKRSGNRPDRRLAPHGSISPPELERLVSQARYGGSALHKLAPGDYGFSPPRNPRPSKSVCDDLRPLLLAEARQLLRSGILKGMVSPFPPGGQPKYVWAVDDAGEVYEAKCNTEQADPYHGYRLGQDENKMRDYILKEWSVRCTRV